ncbi:MAG: YaiI/YqxD family protein [Ruminococcus sp.]|nr:YaiI/YqxD family protein [Ruminococcus sp.]
MEIFIDADGCPVVGLTVMLAKRYCVPVTIICDTAHVFSYEGVRVITVDKGADSADFRLVNLIGKGDIAVTQDYGLAAMCLARNAFAINQNGLVYSDENISSLLGARYAAKKIRKSGGRLKGPQKRKKQQDTEFERTLESLIVNNM